MSLVEAKIRELNIPDRFKQDIEKAVEILKRFNCEEVYIFGSLVTGKYHDASDIDIAMKGIKPELFFDIYSELSFNLHHKVDLLNMDTKQNIANLLFEMGEIVRVA